MPNLQVRVEDEELGELDALAEDLHVSRSDLARNALREGVRRIRMEKALERYLHQRISLARAAQDAGVSLHEMHDLASSRGIPYFRYPVEELKRDTARATRWLKRPR